MLTTSILFEQINKNYPKAELHYVINDFTEPVISHHPFIDKLYIIDDKIENSKRKFYQFLKNIRSEKYDVVIDVYGKYSSNLISLFSRAKIKIGKHKWYSSWIYSHTIEESKTVQTNAGLAIENRVKLLDPICDNVAILQPKIYLTSEELEKAKKKLHQEGFDQNRTLIMLSVLGSDQSKSYPLDYMAQVIDTIADLTQAQLLFNYMPDQATLADEVFRKCTTKTQKQCYKGLLGTDLRSFLAITAHCDALIGNEGGAVNMAKALDISTFTIFSPWILKEAWNMFEDGAKHVSVHLNDFKPGLFASSFEKNKKKDAVGLYAKFKPELWTPILEKYLKDL